MDCPVCGAEAEDMTSSQFDGDSIRCASCHDYDIAGTVYNSGMLHKLDPDQRKAALEKAQRFARGKRPMITSYCL